MLDPRIDRSLLEAQDLCIPCMVSLPRVYDGSVVHCPSCHKPMRPVNGCFKVPNGRQEWDLFEKWLDKGHKNWWLEVILAEDRRLRGDDGVDAAEHPLPVEPKRLCLEDFRHLEKAFTPTEEEWREIFAKLPRSHWEGVARMQAALAKQFEAERKSTTPSHADMHRPFDL